MGRPGDHAREVFIVNTVVFSLGVFNVSESEPGKEQRLGGDSLVRENFVNMRTWVQILGVHINDGCS